MEVVVATAARGGGDAEHEGAERQHLDDEVRLGLGVLGGLEQFVERELVDQVVANEVGILSLRREGGELFFTTDEDRAWRAATQTIFVRFASKKQGGSSSNGRDSNPKFLGLKRGDGEVVRPGHVLARQRGTKWHPGTNCGIGKDHTLFALVQGKVCFSTDKHRGRKLINVAPLSKTHPKYVEGVA